MGRFVVSGVAGPSGLRVQQNEDAVSLLEDIHHRCERLLTSVSEHEWQELEEQYIVPCIGLLLEW